MGAGPGQPDDDEGSITPGSPNNLLLVAVSVGLLFFAGLVFFIAAVFGDSDATWDKWGIAETILLYVGTGVFYAGVLVGLGTLATARSNNVYRRPVAVASLLSKGGAAVVILGVAQAVCIVGATHYGQGWQHKAYQVVFRVAGSVFEGGILAGVWRSSACACRNPGAPGTRRPNPTSCSVPHRQQRKRWPGGARRIPLSAVKRKCKTTQTAIDSRFEGFYN